MRLSSETRLRERRALMKALEKRPDLIPTTHVVRVIGILEEEIEGAVARRNLPCSTDRQRVVKMAQERAEELEAAKSRAKAQKPVSVPQNAKNAASAASVASAATTATAPATLAAPTAVKRPTWLKSRTF